MPKRTLFVVALAAALVACNTKSPVGPSSVTPITSTSTTSSPTTAPTSTIPPTTSTSVPPPVTTRTFVGLGQVAATTPSQLTMVLQPLGGRTIASALLDRLPFFDKQADPLSWSVTGFYVTPGGGRGRVLGQLDGTFDAGSFSGALTSDSAECTAEREFGGSLDAQFLRWSGGTTLRDCKGSPLGFNTLVMLATTAPAPTTTAVSTSTTSMPVQCSYSLSANSISVDAAGGQRTLGLTTGPTCGWTVQNFVDWIAVQPASGSGAATISVTIAANPSTVARSATIIVAGMPVVVNQSGIATTTTSTTSSTSTLPTTTPTTVVTTIPGNMTANRPAGWVSPRLAPHEQPTYRTQ